MSIALVVKKTNRPCSLISFPKLMISKTEDCIILASCESGINIAGTCLDAGKTSNTVGEYSNLWKTSDFVDFEDPICISNKR